MGEVDFDGLFRVAEEQSVVGLFAAGLEHVVDRKITKPQALPFMKKVFAAETRNADMNRFVADLFTKLREAGIQVVLVKGQGIAQCYERPQWRSAGDVDLLLDAENYEKAKSFLTPLSSSVDKEVVEYKHLGMTIDSWEVELHGTLHGHISKVADSVVDQVQDEMFSQGPFRIWKNGETDVPLPAPDSDVVFIFSHILQHFFHGLAFNIFHADCPAAFYILHSEDSRHGNSGFFRYGVNIRFVEDICLRMGCREFLHYGSSVAIDGFIGLFRQYLFIRHIRNSPFQPFASAASAFL
jgi:hypothetical protein